MVVGNDIAAICVNDETGPERCRLAFALLAVITIAEFLEEILERMAFRQLREATTGRLHGLGR